MPLRSADEPVSLDCVRDAREDFIIFYSSRLENGKMWCPDCVAVEDLVQSTFGPAGAPTGLIVYVGQRPEWKSPTNIFRGEPFRIKSIPTIVRVKDGAKLELEDAEGQHSLASFTSS